MGHSSRTRATTRLGRCAVASVGEGGGLVGAVGELGVGGVGERGGVAGVDCDLGAFDPRAAFDLGGDLGGDLAGDLGVDLGVDRDLFGAFDLLGATNVADGDGEVLTGDGALRRSAARKMCSMEGMRASAELRLSDESVYVISDVGTSSTDSSPWLSRWGHISKASIVSLKN